MTETVYHFPELSTPDFGFIRGPGPGLGNLLFPIARALVAQKELGGTFVFPTMRQIKVGPYLRREKDKRTYGEIFRPRSLNEMRDWAHASYLKKLFVPKSAAAPKVISYKGMARQFHDIVGHATLVRGFLEHASRSKVQDVAIDIAIHVRLGDFAAPSVSATKQNTQVPLDWYREAFQTAISVLGKQAPRVVLFSDENPIEVIEKLGLEGLEPEPAGNALTSILLMSRAKVLIGSRSTFSLWGQYLGDSCAIWPEGFELTKYKRPEADMDIFV